MPKEIARALTRMLSARTRGAALEHLAQALGASAPPPELAVLFGLASAGISFGIRSLVSHYVGEGEYFLTAFPFILIVTLLAGGWAGWSSLFFSLLGSWYLFIGAPFSFELGPYEGGILAGSFIVGAITIQVAELLRRAFEELAAVRERDRLLSRELEHRVKNTLTLVLSLSRQTFRADSAIELARSEFEGRIMALAAAQNIVGKTDRQEAQLADIVAKSLVPFCSGRSDRILAAGPSVKLSADAAMGLCLVLHELATNASKYGALSQDGGMIRIAWRILPDGQVALSWHEKGGPRVERPKHSGFGSQLFDRIVTRQLKGRATMDFPETGVIVRITMPLGADSEPGSARRDDAAAVTRETRRA